MHEDDVTRSKANGLKRGRAVLQNSSDSEGPNAEASAQKRPKASRTPQKKAGTPAKASKPGKLQQKGAAAFMKKPGAASAEPEDKLAEQAKALEPTQASQTPVRQQHDAHDACAHELSTFLCIKNPIMPGARCQSALRAATCTASPAQQLAFPGHNTHRRRPLAWPDLAAAASG